ncbi:MAG: glycosyltransferase family 9 protein [Planctomycetota bacterium]
MFRALPPRRPARAAGEPETALVVQPNHIGDLLMTTALLAALKRRVPQTRITVACGPWNRDTLAHNPDVDDIVAIEPPWDNAFVTARGKAASLRYMLSAPAARALAARRFDLGFDMIGARLNGLFLARLGVRRIFGGPWGFRPKPRLGVAHVITGILDLARLAGVDDLPPCVPRVFLSADERRRGEALWHGVPTTGGAARRRIVVAPAGSYAYKRWPTESFVEVVRRLAARPDVALVVVGGADTVEAARAITACGGPVLDLAGRANLRDSFAITATADLVFGNSNMVWHVGGACDVPAVIVLPAAYESADDHATTWGYPSSIVLGRRPSHPDVYTPAEVHAVLDDVLTRLAPRLSDE